MLVQEPSGDVWTFVTHRACVQFDKWPTELRAATMPTESSVAGTTLHLIVHCRLGRHSRPSLLRTSSLGSVEPAELLHIERLEHAVSRRLSDAIEFRFAPLTDGNRAAPFKRHGITMKSRETGSLLGRYQDVAATQDHKLARRVGVQPVVSDDEQ